MRAYHALAAGLLCCFLSCQKEPEGLLTPTACKLENILYYDDNVPYDSAGYEYNGDRVSKVNYAEAEYSTVLEYSADRISKRNYIDEGATISTGYDSLIYNPDGTVDRVDFYLVDPTLGKFLFIQYDFSYTAGKLTLLQTKVDTSGTGPVPFIEYYYDYSGNNISRVSGYDLINNAADTIDYAYDALTNYYSKNPALWLSDNLFMEFDGFLLPFALSNNNVSTLTYRDGSSSAVTYSATSKGEIETLRIDGDLVARYFYKCQ